MDGIACNKTQYSPPAAGSSCSILDSVDDQYFCYNGKCVEIDEVSEVIHGAWGEWGGWSDCSVSCDEGVQQSDRYCNSPM